MVVIILSLHFGLFKSPFMVQIQLTQLIRKVELNCLLNKDYSLHEESYVKLLLHLFPAFVYPSIELKTTPLTGIRVDESDDAVEQVDPESKNIELFRLELMTLIIHVKSASHIKLIRVFAVGYQSVHNDQEHTEETTYVGEHIVDSFEVALVYDRN